MKTVHQVSRLTGVSVRTLHHYHAMGLLPPTQVTAAGYRLYDDAALARLQSILLFRQLQFSLKEIKAMLDAPDFDPAAALQQQICLLRLQRDRLDKLIAFACSLQKNGEYTMDFKAFDSAELQRYKAEAKAKWGATAAWQENQQKAADRDETAAGADLMRIMAAFGPLRGTDAADTTAQKQVAALQTFITENCYTCTDEILAGLGQIYTADQRFTDNIDAVGGAGTAAFIAKAIAVYCGKK